MSDSGFREIQLSGKHVVFLFMAGAVAAVAIFLLGVSVGKGVARPDTPPVATPTPAEAMTAAGPPGELPPPTKPAPGELQYHETLQGKGDAKSAAATPSPSASPEAAPLTPALTPAATPSATPAPKTKAAATAAPATAVWYVPVDAFSSRANAIREVEQLKAKNISATVLEVSGTGARFKVRVGPMERKSADAMVQRLRKEGYKPSAPSR